MSPGGKGRSNKGSKANTEHSGGSAGGGTIHNHQTNKSDHNHNEREKDTLPHKIAPTAEQLRIAQMIDNTHSEKILHEKISQVVQVTGVSTDDAIVALHDCDNDVNAAIDSLLEGEDQGEWRESTKKKKKAPAAKQSKEEAESNKENRRMENRERSGSKPRGGAAGPPRFRGRGGGKGGREEVSEGGGRGSGNRRGKLTNGTGPPRGRGSRGRGSNASNRTFQKRQSQPPGFTETIDTWTAVPTEKIENNVNNLQIDNWDDEQHSSTTEDWDSEWTGSLDKTTVFSPSTSISAPTILGSSPHQDPSPSIITSVPNHTVVNMGGTMNSILGEQASNDSGSGNLPSSLTESVSSVLSMGQSQINNAPMNVSQSYSNVDPSNSITQSQAMDIATLLQKAAPHSSLSNLVSSSLGVENKNLLSGISPSVGDSLKSSLLVNNGPSSVVTSSEPQSYSPSSAAISNSIFSSSVSNLGSSLSSGNAVNKVLGLSSQNASLASRSKPQRNRLPHSSKIPSKAVEMPEVAMAALDMQFTGLEFGTETFDFTSDVKSPLLGSGLVSTSSVSSRGDPSSVSASVSKELSGLNSTISQPQSLGPQPIPYPTQATERKPQSSLLSGPQRASAPSASAQSLTELTKKDTTSSGGPSLGSLVGPTASGHAPYQSSSNTGYGSKASSFPSPPAHYTQNPSQNYSSSSSSGVGNNNYAGASLNSNSVSSTNSSNNSSANPSAGSGYGSNFSSQVSTGSGQYQNNYVSNVSSVSSHSLASSMNVSKTHSAGLKDASQVIHCTQSYNETSSSLSASLSSSAGGSSSGSSLSASLNASTSSSAQQPSKSSVPGKTVNSLGGAVPPGVAQHSVSQQHQQQLNQHHQPHHHLQQHQQQQQQQQQVAQQTQTQQLMAGPSQYVSPQQAALQGALPPPFYNVQQPPAMYSFEDLQLFQQRITHMPQAPSTLPGGREGSITSPSSYSVAEANKFRTDQNSSPVPSTINQQGAAAGATYITAPGNAGMPPFYMYQTMPAVPSTFSQYGAPTIIQIPSNTHTGSTTTQFPGPPKLAYGGTSNYYDNISQTQDYKTGYASGSQGQNKTGPNSTGSASNSGSDLAGYKNHLSKVSRTYEKQGFHTGTPPPFNLPGSGTNAIAANYAPMFIPTMPAAAQHHSTLIHHQLHQDGGSTAAQRSATGGAQNKGGSKGSFTGSYWGN